MLPALSDDATGFIDRTLKISATGLSTIDPSIFYPRGAIAANAKIKFLIIAFSPRDFSRSPKRLNERVELSSIAKVDSREIDSITKIRQTCMKIHGRETYSTIDRKTAMRSLFRNVCTVWYDISRGTYGQRKAFEKEYTP